MQRTWKTLTLAAMTAALVLAGCSCKTTSTMDDTTPTASGGPKMSAAPAPAGMTKAVAYFPTGNKESSVLMVERLAPEEVYASSPFDYSIMVTNLSKMPAASVKLVDVCVDHFKIVAATPTPVSIVGNTVTWDLGTIAPGETKTIKVRGQTDEVAIVTNCLSVSYDQSACVAINVVKPGLDVVMEATPEVIKCDPIAVKYTVTNTGTGTATGVKLEQTLAEGLTTDTGAKTVTIDVGDLAGGESKSFAANVMASTTGKFDHTVNATADKGLTDSATASTVAKAPKLEITKTGPEKIFLGRSVVFNISVKNVGDAPARDAVLEDVVSSGGTVAAASEGGVITGNTVTWTLGTLAPGAEVMGTVTVTPAGKGTIENTAMAKAYCAQPVNAMAKTAIEGIPAILLEVVDITDPVEVGGSTVYEITATNQGSAVGTNIRITAILEDTQEFVSAEGAHKVDGKTITFDALPSLAPGAEHTWKVTVKALNPGDVRFGVKMISDQITRDVTETESTNFYK